MPNAPTLPKKKTRSGVRNLSPGQVKKLRQMASSGYSDRQLAHFFLISQNNVYKIRTGKIYKDVI